MKHIQLGEKKHTSHHNVIFILWPNSYRGASQHQHSTVLSTGKFQGKKQTPFHPSQHVLLLPLVYSPFRPGRKSWIWLRDDFGQSWRPWIRIKRRVIPICEKLQTGSVYKLKPFLFWWEECPFSFLFFFTWRVPLCLRSLFSLDGRSITPSQIRSSQLMTFSIAGTQAALSGELFSLPAVRPLLLLYYCFCISCYY